MEITRSGTDMIRLPAGRNALKAVTFDRNSLSSSRQNGTTSQHLTGAPGESAPQPEIKFLREITGPVFSRAGSAGYSAPFIAQQIAQGQNEDSNGQPTPAFLRATAAYDDTLGLTATVLGLQGARERIA